MSGVGLLHNMSVPPRSTVRVRRSFLAGRRYAIDARALRPALQALREQGAVAALALLDPEGPTFAAALARQRRDDAEAVLAARLTRELASAGVPDRVGVFTEWDEDVQHTAFVPRPLGLALLARRSGCLYLPRRRFAPSLVMPTRAILIFPEP